MVGFGPHGDDFSEQDQLEVVDFLGAFDGEVDGDLIRREFDLQVVLLVHHVGNLYAHLRWSLVPIVGEFGTQQLVFGHVFLAQLEDRAS